MRGSLVRNLGGTIAVAVAFGLGDVGYVAAQEAGDTAAPPPTEAAADGTVSAKSPTSGPRPSPTLEEIVVTARRREENMQDVPVAVTGLSAEDLQTIGVRTITDLQQSVPGLQFGESGAKTPSIFIRGIGQREGNAVLDPGVGVYINDVFIPRQDAQLLDTVDTESIQVLRGPQGTLFGKNTTGGAILITTRKPDFDGYEGEVGTRFGTFGRRDLTLRGNAPLIEDSMAARFALNVTHLDGYLENDLDDADFGDEDRISATTRLVWNPTDTLTTEIFGYWSRQHEHGTGITCIFQNPDSNLAEVDWPAQPDFEDGCRHSEEVAERNEVSLNTETSFTRMSTGILALTADWTIGAFELKSITGFNAWWGIDRNDDQDASSVTILSTGTGALNGSLENDGKPTEDEKRYQVSQELRLQSSAFADKLRYTVGAFGSMERVRDFPFTTLVGPNGLGDIRPSTVTGMVGIPAELGLLDDTFRIPFPTLLGTRSDLDNDSAAFFAQASYDLTDWLQLTAGGRYTYEDRTRDLDTIDVDLNTYCPRVQGVPLATTGLCSPITLAQFDLIGQNPPALPLVVNESADVRSETWSEFTPSATLSVNAPESWLDGRADSLLAYFTYSTGFKAGGFEPRGDALVSFDPEKVMNYEVGFKTDLLDRRLRVNGAGYHLSYDDIQVRVAEQGPMITDIFLFLSNASKAQVTGGELEGTLILDDWLFHASAAYTWARYDEFLTTVVIPGQGSSTADRSAEDFALVPEKTLSLAAEYHWDTSVGTIAPRLSYYFRDELFTGIDEKAIEFRSSFIDAVSLVNARVAWLYDDHLRVTGFVNNLLDEEYFASGFSVSALLGAATLVQGPQRAFGFEVAYQF